MVFIRLSRLAERRRPGVSAPFPKYHPLPLLPPHRESLRRSCWLVLSYRPQGLAFSCAAVREGVHTCPFSLLLAYLRHYCTYSYSFKRHQCMPVFLAGVNSRMGLGPLFSYNLLFLFFQLAFSSSVTDGREHSQLLKTGCYGSEACSRMRCQAVPARGV